jgi:hypothetical protein
MRLCTSVSRIYRNTGGYWLYRNLVKWRLVKKAPIRTVQYNKQPQTTQLLTRANTYFSCLQVCNLSRVSLLWAEITWAWLKASVCVLVCSKHLFSWNQQPSGLFFIRQIPRAERASGTTQAYLNLCLFHMG